MHPISILFVANLASVALKAISATGTTASSVFIDMLNDAGDTVGLGLLLLGLSYEKRRSSIAYPYGLRRALYVLGLISMSIISGSMFAVAVFNVASSISGVRELVISPYSIYAFIPAFALNVYGLLLVLKHANPRGRNPALSGGLLDSVSDTIGSALALGSITLGNPGLDVAGSAVLACVILVSAITIGYRYFQVLIGRAPPRSVLRRVLENLLRVSEVKDVNVFNAVMLTEDEYMLVLEVEVDKSMDVEDLERLSAEIEEEVRNVEPRFKHIIVEFVAERREPKTYRSILHEIENSLE